MAAEPAGAWAEAEPASPQAAPAPVTLPPAPTTNQASSDGDDAVSVPAPSPRLTGHVTERAITDPVHPAPVLVGGLQLPVGPVAPCIPLGPLPDSTALCPTGTTDAAGGSFGGSAPRLNPVVAVLPRSGTPASGIAVNHPDEVSAGSPAGETEEPAVTPD